MTKAVPPPEPPPECDRAWALYDVENISLLSDPHLQQVLEGMLDISDFERFGGASYKFGGGGGVTALAIIGASLAAFHTWPEHRSMIVNLFYCHDHTRCSGGNNDAKAERFERCIVEYFKPGRIFRLPTRMIPVTNLAIVPAGWQEMPQAATQNVERLPSRRRAIRG